MTRGHRETNCGPGARDFPSRSKLAYSNVVLSLVFCLLGALLMIRGVTFLFDERGRRTGVMIDLRQGRGFWEDILDVATARSREREASDSWAAVRTRLEKSGRLKKGRRRA